MSSIVRLFLFTFACGSFALAQSDFITSNIPGFLKENADAVVRYDKTTLRMINPGLVKVKVEQAVTVLNKSGDPFGYIRVDYDSKLEKAKIRSAITLSPIFCTFRLL